MKPSKAELYAANWSSQGFYKAVLCAMPEAYRFRVQRAFRNPVVAECNLEGRLHIRKSILLSHRKNKCRRCG